MSATAWSRLVRSSPTTSTSVTVSWPARGFRRRGLPLPFEQCLPGERVVPAASPSRRRGAGGARDRRRGRHRAEHARRGADGVPGADARRSRARLGRASGWVRRICCGWRPPRARWLLGCGTRSATCRPVRARISCSCVRPRGARSAGFSRDADRCRRRWGRCSRSRARSRSPRSGWPGGSSPDATGDGRGAGRVRRG